MFSDFLNFLKNSSAKLDKLGNYLLLGLELSQRENGINEWQRNKLPTDKAEGW